jgi:ABC-2 type transport system permease protein
MSHFWSLIKLELKQNNMVSRLTSAIPDQKKWQKLFIYLSLGASFLVFLFIFILPFYRVLYEALLLIKQQSVMLAIILFLSQFIIFFFAVGQVMTTLFFSKDIETLLPLPIKSWHITAAKLVNMYLYLLLLNSILSLPGYLLYAYGESLGIAGCVGLFLLFILTPVLPLIIAALLSTLLMSVLNIRRFKDYTRILGGLFGLIIFILFQFMLVGKGADSLRDIEILKSLLEQENGILSFISTYYPIGVWVVNAISQPFITSGWIYWGLLIGLHVIALIAMVGLAQALFYRGVVGGNESTRKVSMSNRRVKAHSPVRALFIKEWKIFLRTPAFLIQGFTSVAIIIIMFIFSMISSSRVENMKEMAVDLTFQVILVWIVAGIITLISSLNLIALTSISREGKSFRLSKIIPLSARIQIKAKWLHANSMAIFISPLIFIFIYGLVGLPIFYSLASIALGIIGASFFTSMAIWFDLNFHRLAWTNENQAMQSGIGGLFFILSMFGIVGILAVLIIIATLNKVPFLLTYFMVIGLVGLGSYFLYRRLLSFAEKKYTEIEI